MKAFKWLLFFLMLSSLSGFSKQEDFVVEKSLNDLWMDYNKDLKSFVPTKRYLFKNKRVAHLSLNVADQTKFLVFKNEEAVQLFINNQLFKAFNAGSHAVSFKEIKSFSKKPSLILSAYSEEDVLGIAYIFIGKKRMSSSLATMNFQPQNRAFSQQTPIILCLLFAGLVLAFVKSSKPVTYKAYFDFTMHFRNIEDHVIFNSFSKTAILLPVIVAFLGAASLSLCGYSFFSEESSLAFWLKITADAFIIMLFLFSKYFFLSFLSWLLNIRGLRKTHFFEFTRITTQYAVVLFVFALLTYNRASDYTNILIYLSLFFLFFLSFKLFNDLNREYKFSNLFLFFYFCSAELFPLFLLVKQLVKSGI